MQKRRRPLAERQHFVIRRHADDFTGRRGFTYAVLDPDTGDVVGCVYIYPDAAGPRRASVQSWVRVSRAELDVPLWRAVSAWLATAWPFESVAYATREPDRWMTSSDAAR